jgi:branched-subunit amino acid aminotransferase/4-amino-4-deoxychorismate lyase
MKSKSIIFLNGKFLPEKEARISILEPAFLYGWGLFETMRAYNNKIIYLDEHLKRIKNSCKLIKLTFPYSLKRLKEIIKKSVKINGFQDSYVRLTLCKGLEDKTATLVWVRKYHPLAYKKYKTGFRVSISRFRQNEDSYLARLKTNNYLLYQLIYLEAKDKNFDEAVILNNRGYITEASRANLFFIKDKEIFTPSLECGCLRGITRKVIFDLAKRYNIKINEGRFTLKDLYGSDEAFLTNSLIGVMPFASLERKNIGKDKCQRLTKFFIAKYNSLLK